MDLLRLQCEELSNVGNDDFLKIFDILEREFQEDISFNYDLESKKGIINRLTDASPTLKHSSDSSSTKEKNNSKGLSRKRRKTKTDLRLEINKSVGELYSVERRERNKVLSRRSRSKKKTEDQLLHRRLRYLESNIAALQTVIINAGLELPAIKPFDPDLEETSNPVHGHLDATAVDDACEKDEN